MPSQPEASRGENRAARPRLSRLAGVVVVCGPGLAAAAGLVLLGTRGPAPALLVLPVLAAGLVVGWRAAWLAVLAGLALTAGARFLEIQGWLPLAHIAPGATQAFDGLAWLCALGGTAVAGGLESRRLNLKLHRARTLLQASQEQSAARVRDLEAGLRPLQEYSGRWQAAVGDLRAYLGRVERGEPAPALAPVQDEDLADLAGQVERLVSRLEEARLSLEAARRETESVHRRYLIQPWQAYARSRASRNFNLRAARHPGQPPAGSPALAEAVSGRRALINPRSQPGEPPQPALAVPLTLRGEIIGVLGLAREPGQRPWAHEELALVTAVADRLALAIDNLRLLEDAQRSAAREAFLAQAAAHIRATLDIDSILQSAAREAGLALGLKEVTLELHPEPGAGGSAQASPPERARTGPQATGEFLL